MLENRAWSNKLQKWENIWNNLVQWCVLCVLCLCNCRLYRDRGWLLNLCKRRRRQLKVRQICSCNFLSESQFPNLRLLSYSLSRLIPIVLIPSPYGSTRLFIYVRDKALRCWTEGYIQLWTSTEITNTRQDWGNKNTHILRPSWILVFFLW